MGHNPHINNTEKLSERHFWRGKKSFLSIFLTLSPNGHLTCLRLISDTGVIRKKLVYAGGQTSTVAEIRERIVSASQQISRENILSALSCFLDRLHLILESDGEHVEQYS